MREVNVGLLIAVQSQREWWLLVKNKMDGDYPIIPEFPICAVNLEEKVFDAARLFLAGLTGVKARDQQGGEGLVDLDLFELLEEGNKLTVFYKVFLPTLAGVSSNHRWLPLIDSGKIYPDHLRLLNKLISFAGE